MKKYKNTIIVILSILLIILLIRFVIFKNQFEKLGEGLKRVDIWQENYKKEHPDATKQDMDAAFKAGITNIDVWQENYKKEHPDATDEDVSTAFNNAWNQ